MARLIHTAQALVDLVCDVPGLPPRGGNVMAAGVTRQPGGAAIILIAAARSGATAVHAGSVGSGINADLIRHALHSEGVEVTSPPVEQLDTGVCVVLLEPTAERTFVTTWGAERQVSVGSFDTSAPQPGDLVCVSGYSLVEPTLTPLLAWLEGLPIGDGGQRVDVVLDPGAIFAELPPEVVSRVLAVTTVWTSNMDEASALVGTDEMDRAAGLVAGRLSRARAVVVRDGDQGCAVWHGSRTEVIPGFPQRAVDTNGAGDTHTGAMVAAVTRGLSWADAARYANAAAGLKVTGKGLGSIPHREAVEEFLRLAD
ncbi:PfkB family carbohydrate kinase [Aestuariimicrobium sp. T2.26MG-19.2B]|uniref:PfkB family carbohydrate kinase n=1 Tax=Aestuariimicrobium sp. T2.26MG-19.2B TaxID=3040679 RepID=UPI002477A600|nr:PfkB family carbohydrate kinase [Aestuariimicrobium sp. T2.26MG-19.2B]CAI9407408.1 Bifunctional ribokinase/ribose-5-phosphate isomerase A [Aestuariimicrobium sp. T2.26MG-19.2B]